MRTKLSIVQEHMASGHWKNAIRIAARFPQLGDHRGAILDAHMAYTNPRFLTQIGKDIQAAKDAGIAAMEQRFAIS